MVAELKEVAGAEQINHLAVAGVGEQLEVKAATEE